MHGAVKSFIKEVKNDLPYKFRNRTVLEVGSHNINGSPRKFFWFCRYTGVDISKGRGVDIVGNFNDVKFDKQYQVVVSCEMLEHDKTWDKSLRKMYNLLQDNGLLLITCAGPDRMEHGTARTTPEASPDTTDYYRNISKEDFKSILPPELFDMYVLQYGRGENDLYFYGIKKSTLKPDAKSIYKALMNAQKSGEHTVHIPKEDIKYFEKIAEQNQKANDR